MDIDERDRNSEEYKNAMGMVKWEAISESLLLSIKKLDEVRDSGIKPLSYYDLARYDYWYDQVRKIKGSIGGK